MNRKKSKTAIKLEYEFEIRMQENFRREILDRIGLNKITTGMLKASELKSKHLQNILK